MIRDAESRLITLMRFPLMVGVVCIHTDLRIVRPDLRDLPLFAELMNLFVDFISSAAVPLFFFFSGYLFSMTLSGRSFRNHLRRRLRSIAVPYVLWTLLCLAVVAVCQQVNPGFRLLLHKSVGDFSVSDFLWMFWDISRSTGIDADQHGPLVGQFWFLQCLMVQMICSPVLLWLSRRVGYITSLLLFIVYAWGLLPQVSGIHAGALFYYFLGLLCAAKKPHFIDIISRYGWAALPVFLILYIFKHHLMPSLPDALWAVETMLMALGELWIAWKWLNRRHTATAWLASSSFFIFASHRFLTATFTNLARSGHLPLGNSASATATYFLGTAVTVALCVGAYALLQRLMPNILSLLTGGRMNRRA